MCKWDGGTQLTWYHAKFCHIAHCTEFMHRYAAYLAHISVNEHHMSLIYITPHYAILLGRAILTDVTCVIIKWRVILRYQALDWFWYSKKGKAKIGIIQFKYQSRFQQRHWTSVQCPGLRSHGFDKSFIQLLPPILWQHMFGQPSVQSAASPSPTVSHGLPFLAPFQTFITERPPVPGGGLKAWPQARRASFMQSIWTNSEHLVQYCESRVALYIFWHVHVKLMPCQTRLSQVAGLKDGEYIPWTKAPRWVWTHTLVDNTMQLGEATLPWHPVITILWYVQCSEGFG